MCPSMGRCTPGLEGMFAFNNNNSNSNDNSNNNLILDEPLPDAVH